jgi:hypothetical protein
VTPLPSFSMTLLMQALCSNYFSTATPSFFIRLTRHFGYKTSHLFSFIINLHRHSATSCNHQQHQHLSYTTILARAVNLVKPSFQESGGTFEFVELQQQTVQFCFQSFFCLQG